MTPKLVARTHEGGRRSAALQMAQDGDPSFKSCAFFDHLRHHCADAADCLSSDALITCSPSGKFALSATHMMLVRLRRVVPALSVDGLGGHRGYNVWLVMVNVLGPKSASGDRRKPSIGEAA